MPRMRPGAAAKTISRQGITGQRGVNVIPRWGNLRRECAHTLRSQYPVAEKL